MPRPPYRPRALQWQVFRGSLAISDGLLTPHQLRSSAWVRVRHDIYADSRLDHDHRLECEAVALWLPPGAVVAGPSAASLYGVEHAARFGDEVHVIAPPEQPSMGQRGIRVHHTQLATGEIHATGGVQRTTPLRTAWDLAAWLDVAPAVSIIDGLLAAGLVHPTALIELTRAKAGQRGCRRPLAHSTSPTAGPSRPPSRCCGSGWCFPVCPDRCHNIRSYCPTAPSTTLICPGPTTGSRLSTTASGTTIPINFTATGAGSTTWSPRAGSSFT